MDTQRKRSNTLTDCPKKGRQDHIGRGTLQMACSPNFCPLSSSGISSSRYLPISYRFVPRGSFFSQPKKKKSIHIFRPWSRPFFFLFFLFLLLLLRARCHKSIPLMLLLLLLRVLPRKVVLPRGEKCDVTPCHRPSNLLVLNRPGTFCGVHRFSVGVSLSSRVK